MGLSKPLAPKYSQENVDMSIINLAEWKSKRDEEDLYMKSLVDCKALMPIRELLNLKNFAAEALGMGLNEMLGILAKRKTYINYGTEELDEDISYARS